MEEKRKYYGKGRKFERKEEAAREGGEQRQNGERKYSAQFSLWLEMKRELQKMNEKLDVIADRMDELVEKLGEGGSSGLDEAIKHLKEVKAKDNELLSMMLTIIKNDAELKNKLVELMEKMEKLVERLAEPNE